MSVISERIVAARRAKGMTRDALAKAMCVSRSTVAQWETHGVAFTIDRLEMHTFLKDGVDSRSFDARFLDENGSPSTIDANGDWQIIGGMPGSERVLGIGFRLCGTDATGEAPSFVCCQSLTV